jgi:Ca2+-binding RTX toxin-like protein
VFFVSGTNTVTATETGTLTLNSADSLTGGNGVDTLNLNLSSIAANYTFNFGTMTGKFIDFENVVLSANPASTRNVSLTFGNANIFAGQTITVDGHLDTNASPRTFTVSASGVNDGGNFIFIGSGSTNIFTGGSGNDTFQLTTAQFAATAHTLAGGAGTDTIQITNAATNVDLAFTGVSGIEALLLGNFLNSITLAANANTAVGAGNTLTIDDSASASSKLTLNASSFTSNLNVVTGGGDDALTGGSGNDTFNFTNAHLTSADTVAGNGGTDAIKITDTAAVIDSMFNHVTGVETLLLSDFTNSVTLGTLAGTAIGSGGTLKIDDTAAASNHPLTVDATALTSTAHLNIFGGAGDDVFKFTNAHFTGAESINGEAGSDTIQITDAATVVDAAFTNVSNVEKLLLGDFTNSITLGAKASLSIGTGTLTVDGSVAGASHAQTIDGSAVGASAHLNIVAGAGNDMLTGGSAADSLTGGAGADTFVFRNFVQSLATAPDTITDFVTGIDFIAIGHSLTGLTTASANGSGSLAADLANILTGGNFVSGNAAEVTINGGSDAGTYAVLNHGAAGFDAAHDAVIKLANAAVLHTADFVV